MRFRTLLIHRCSLLTIGTVSGTDDYGRDIISRIVYANVPCRFDHVQQTAVLGDTGTDFIYEDVLYFDSDIPINLGDEIHDIQDKKGNPVLPGSFSIQKINPFYDRSKLHHYEVSIRGM